MSLRFGGDSARVSFGKAMAEYRAYKADPQAYAAKQERIGPGLIIARILFVLVFGGALVYWALLHLGLLP